jgi:hypothetical protein
VSQQLSAMTDDVLRVRMAAARARIDAARAQRAGAEQLRSANSASPRPGRGGYECQLCFERVYRYESVTVGPIFHRQCFKCTTCRRHLGGPGWGPGWRFSGNWSTAPEQRALYCPDHWPPVENSPASERV